MLRLANEPYVPSAKDLGEDCCGIYRDIGEIVQKTVKHMKEVSGVPEIFFLDPETRKERTNEYVFTITADEFPLKDECNAGAIMGFCQCLNKGVRIQNRHQGVCFLLASAKEHAPVQIADATLASCEVRSCLS